MKNNIKEIFCNKSEKRENIFQIKKRHYGILNHGKVLYYINETSELLGFFAMYRCWLEYLYFADVCGFVPVIDAGKQSVYREEKRILGTSNVFEYYFNQPALIGVNELKKSSSVIDSNIFHRQMVEMILTGKTMHYDYNKNYMLLMSQVIRKYLKFNNATQNYIKKGLESLQFNNENILGIHMRGSDFRRKYDGHPIFVTEKEYFNVIDYKINLKKYDKIFLATDDQKILNSFIERYGERIYYYEDVLRSNDSISVAFHKSERNHHRYYLGLEVLRDMYTLSMCNGLVAGISQVSICAQINKLARKERYEDIIILNNGINKNGHYFK